MRPDSGAWMPAPPPHPIQSGTGCGPPRHGQPHPTGGSKTGLIIAGVVVLVVVLCIGVAVGYWIRSGDASAVPAGATATSARGNAAPTIYAMSTITNACDLADPTPLTKWSSTPKGAPTTRAYVVRVQDGNVSVRVKVDLSREDKGGPVASWDELDSIARSRVRLALDRLKK